MQTDAARPVMRLVAPTSPATRDRVPTATGLGVLIGALCAFGLVMVGSASPVISLADYGSPWTLFIRQVMWMALGGVLLVLLARIDYHKWRKVRVVLLVATLVMLMAVLLPGLGKHAGGSSRWLGFGMVQLQPSELMKLALVIFAADLVARRTEVRRPSGRYQDRPFRSRQEARAVLVPILVVLAMSALLILMQPDMGTAMVLCCIALGVLFLGGVPMAPIAKVMGGLVVLAVIVGLADPYRRDRILSFLNPGAHQAGSGYQVWQSLIGLGSGNVFGLGLGGGRAKWGSLPNAHTDFIFSVVGEELGLVGAVLLLALFFALAWYGVRTALRAPDRFGSLMAVGITVWITSEAIINVGAVIGVLPVTGIPLPFVSYGGSSLAITMAACGILLNIATHERSPAEMERLDRRQTVA